MVIRIAGLGYQKGFGGHFHNDDSLSVLRDLPGVIVAVPSRGDDAIKMLRTLVAAAQVDGRVCVFVEPIALYHTRDLFPGDGAWSFPFPAQTEAIDVGEVGVYEPVGGETNGGGVHGPTVIFTYGNGVPMSLRAAKTRALAASAGNARRNSDSMRARAGSRAPSSTSASAQPPKPAPAKREPSTPGVASRISWRRTSSGEPAS